MRYGVCNIYSNRKQDNIEEAIVARLMDKIYTKNGYQIQRMYDYDTQIKGVDVILTDKLGNKLLVDEKAAVRYIGVSLPTFLFELSSNNNYNKVGWFLNTNTINTHYCLIWPRSDTNDIRKLTTIEYCLISKNTIVNYILESCKYETLTDLYKLVQKVKTQKVLSNGRAYIYIRSGLKIVYSPNIMPEQPVNLVVSKYILKSISDKTQTVFIRRKT